MFPLDSHAELSVATRIRKQPTNIVARSFRPSYTIFVVFQE